MNKLTKNVFIIFTLFLLMLGVVSAVSADERTWTPTEFLGNISNIQDGDNITISNGTANVSTNYNINKSNVVIQAKTGATVIFKGDSTLTNRFLTITGYNVTLNGITFKNFNKGGILWTGDNGTLTQCEFTNNTESSGDGGAIRCEGSEENYINKFTIINCTFKENKATSSFNLGSGGAIYGKWIDNFTIDSCNFSYNDAEEEGGAIDLYNCNVSFNNCKFYNNNPLNETRYGTVCLYNCGVVNLTNCEFNNNVGKECGGFYCYDSKVKLINCTFTNITATQYGGAIHNQRSNCTITNCSFEDCKGRMFGEAIVNEDGNLTVSGGSGAFILNVDGLITNTVSVIILGNKTINVEKDENFELSAFIKAENYTIIDYYSDFKFTINGENITGNLNVDHYTANYDVVGNVGDELLVNGTYTYTGAIDYETGTLLIKDIVSLTGENVNLPYNENIEIKLNATTSNGTPVKNGTVSITINGKTYTGEVSNGKVTVKISDKIDAGIYPLTAIYNENRYYVNDTFDFILNISQIESMVVVNVDDVSYGETAIVKIATIPKMTGNITLIINGNFYDVSTDTMEFPIVDKLNAGSYDVFAIYSGDRNFKYSRNFTSFTVKQIATYTNVSVESVSGGVVIYINTIDIDGKPAEGYVTVLVNSSHTYSTLIKNGTGKLSINDLPTGHYSAVVTFNSTGNYGVSYDNCSFDITSTPSGFDLIGYNVYKEFENDTQYHVKVTDSLGNPLANMTVLVSISSSKWSKNANYTIVTGKDGIATLMINLLVGDYKITAHFADKVAINNITVIATNFNLKADSFIKYFMNGTQYTVKVSDVNNNPVANRTVTIAINKASWKSPVKYYVKTNGDGIATLDINLIAGTYSVTANICYNSTKSSITVLPTLTAESIVKKVNKAGSLKAKLVDGEGNPAQGREVTFTVGLKTYYLTTDASGIATLPINLHIGTWSFLIGNPDTGATTKATVKVIK